MKYYVVYHNFFSFREECISIGYCIWRRWFSEVVTNMVLTTKHVFRWYLWHRFEKRHCIYQINIAHNCFHKGDHYCQDFHHHFRKIKNRSHKREKKCFLEVLLSAEHSSSRAYGSSIHVCDGYRDYQISAVHQITRLLAQKRSDLLEEIVLSTLLARLVIKRESFSCVWYVQSIKPVCILWTHEKGDSIPMSWFITWFSLKKHVANVNNMKLKFVV